MKGYAVAVALLALLLIVSGCEREPVGKGPKYGSERTGRIENVYRFATHPLHNPVKLSQAYQPLIDYLNKKIPNGKFVLEASRDYPSYEAKIREGKLEFLLPNPWQTLEEIKVGYNVIAMAGDAKDFKGLFLVRKESKINAPADLKGKAVSYPAATALAACIMPQYFLHSHGLDVLHDIDNRYVGSQESSIMNAFLGQTAAGVTWPPPWRTFQKEHPKEAGELKVIWETESLINNSVMARKDIPPDIQKQVRDALLELNESPGGAAILSGMETDRFFAANNDSYDVVRRYVERFEHLIRKVENK